IELARPDGAGHGLQDVAIERRFLVLLHDAPVGVPSRKLVRIDVIPDLDVARDQSLIPAADPTSRHRDGALGAESKRGHDPMQERHPVERFEADFRDPWPENDRPAATDDALDFLFDLPLEVEELSL